MDKSVVETFYDGKAQYEWDRLTRHKMEYALTLRAFGEYLPGPPRSVLDIGGGPGRYAVALAQQGYAVTLFDLSAPCLGFAKSKAEEGGVEIAAYIHGNGTDLSRFADNSFDVVLLMGPLYHLLEGRDREKAVREAARVLRPGGIIFASFITRYGNLLWAAKNAPDWLLIHREYCEEQLTTGVATVHHIGSTSAGFTDAYFAHPSEVKPLLESGGFETLDLIATEGIAGLVEEKMNELTGDLWEAWVEMNYRLGQDPSVHGAAFHLLYVGRKMDGR